MAKTPRSRQVDLGQYFPDVLGFDEIITRGITKTVNPLLYEKVRVEKRGSMTFMTCAQNQREFCIGSFELPSLEDLEEEYQRLLARGMPQKPGQIHVRIGQGFQNTINLRAVDVAALQAEAENLGATFQVASNFNCLEFTHAGDSPAHGVSRYIFDKTQGPAASISCAPATIFRNYFVPHSGATGQLESQVVLSLSRNHLPLARIRVHLHRSKVDFSSVC